MGFVFTPGAEPTLQTMLDHLNGVSASWFLIGIALKVQYNELKGIQDSHPKDVQRCLSEMIQHWLYTTPSACWKQVASALERLNLNRVASAIKKEYLWSRNESE